MPLKEQIESVRNQFLADIESFPQAPPLIDQLKSKYLGRKGLIAQLFSKMSQVKSEDRPRMGQELNSLKIELTRQFENKVASVLAPGKKSPDEAIDLTLPGKAPRLGSVHILEQTLSDIKEIFRSIGFHVAYGPEVDDDYHNFSALNIPEPHPSAICRIRFLLMTKPYFEHIRLTYRST